MHRIKGMENLKREAKNDNKDMGNAENRVSDTEFYGKSMWKARIFY